jgi:hypothetical protein
LELRDITKLLYPAQEFITTSHGLRITAGMFLLDFFVLNLDLASDISADELHISVSRHETYALKHGSNWLWQNQ